MLRIFAPKFAKKYLRTSFHISNLKYTLNFRAKKAKNILEYCSKSITENDNGLNFRAKNLSFS